MFCLFFFFKAEQSGEQYPNKFILQEMVPCLRQLPMPPDYAITEYRSLLHLQITDLVTTTHWIFLLLPFPLIIRNSK